MFKVNEILVFRSYGYKPSMKNIDIIRKIKECIITIKIKRFSREFDFYYIYIFYFIYMKNPLYELLKNNQKN